MATTTQELDDLIIKARQRGAYVNIRWDREALLSEGRMIIQHINVHGLPGVGPGPMSPVFAAERLREALTGQC